MEYSSDQKSKSSSETTQRGGLKPSRLSVFFTTLAKAGVLLLGNFIFMWIVGGSDLIPYMQSGHPSNGMIFILFYSCVLIVQLFISIAYVFTKTFE